MQPTLATDEHVEPVELPVAEDGMPSLIHEDEEEEPQLATWDPYWVVSASATSIDTKTTPSKRNILAEFEAQPHLAILEQEVTPPRKQAQVDNEVHTSETESSADLEAGWWRTPFHAGLTHDPQEIHGPSQVTRFLH